ncbi:hypothetical protein [Stenotrophomonas rhizophila]|uniref:hypothetical protein n=1 Tax=Stenotrophomonas rhizophila TaxID=216778 RepID=UPI0028ACA25A|nr:hypothetical protein [Stenotrophomonas rhizophila]
MNDTEKRALFCRIDSKLMQGMDRMAANVMVSATDLQNLRRLAAGRTPQGHVAVPVRPTDPMKDAVESIKMPHAYLRTGVRIADFEERYSAMLAARPEVSGG